MPTDLDGIAVFKKARILYAPGKAAMPAALPCLALRWPRIPAAAPGRKKNSSKLLKDIMHGSIRAAWILAREKDGFVDYVRGANLAGLQESGRRHAGLRRR